MSKSCSRPCLISGKRCDMFTTSGNWSPMADKVLPTADTARTANAKAELSTLLLLGMATMPVTRDLGWSLR